MGLGCLIIATLSFLTPHIEPLTPTGLGSLASVSPYEPDNELTNQDFSTRPLFVPTRQPWRPEPTPRIVEPKMTPEVVAEAQEISGISLAGIFSSGETRGVIVLEDSGHRSRLLVGEQIQEWTLASVGPRSAVFRNEQGEARLDMSLVSSPSSYVKEVEAPALGAVGTAGDKAVPGDPEPVYVPTFENMYKRKRNVRSAPQADGGTVSEGEPAAPIVEE